MKSFEGKRILIIMPKFFGYEEDIKRRLQERGATVFMYSDRPSTNNLMKILIRIHPSLAARSAGKWVSKIIERHRQETFNFIFVLKGESLSLSMLKDLFAAIPSDRKIFYMWDSFKNVKDSRRKLQLFDKSFTFDAADALDTPALQFRPLFFCEDFLSKTEDEYPVADLIDLVFVGTMHTDRYRVLSKLDAFLPSTVKRYFYIYIHSKTIYFVRRLLSPQLWRSKKSEFQFKPLSRSEIIKLFHRARIIVNVERPIQTGLTIRTLEALAAGKKLITTNHNIVNYDFYDPQNIAVIDRREPKIEKSFLTLPYRSVSSNVMNKYSLDTWLDDIFV